MQITFLTYFIVYYIFPQKLLDRFDYDDEPDDIMAKEGSAQSQ